MTQLVPVRVTQMTQVGAYSISTFLQANQEKTQGSGHTRQSEPRTKQQKQTADAASRETLTRPGSFSVSQMQTDRVAAILSISPAWECPWEPTQKAPERGNRLGRSGAEEMSQAASTQ